MNRPLLEKEFEQGQIKQRQGNFGHTLDYVEGHAVIARLNEAFDGNWTFEVTDHKILNKTDEVLVLGKLTAEGITKMAFGSKEIARLKETKEIISLGDDFKAAATDSLKKAATLFGVGLYLYSDSKGNGKQETPKSPDNRDSNGDGKDGKASSEGFGDNGGRLTNKQLAAIFAIGKSKRLQSKDIKEKARKTFNKNIDFLTKKEASEFIETLSR